MTNVPIPSLTGDQRALTAALRELLEREHTVAQLREWPAARPRLRRLLQEFGLPGLLAPTGVGGLGLGSVEAVLVAIELGRAGVALPVFDTVLTVRSLVEARDADSAIWLQRLLAGDADASLVAPGKRYAVDADSSATVLVVADQQVRLASRAECVLSEHRSSDPLRRLSSIVVPGSTGVVINSGPAAVGLVQGLGALTTSGFLVGLAARMLADAVAHASTREQFGTPIGAFQAVAHRLADSAVLVESATVACVRAAADFDGDSESPSPSVARVHCGDAARRVTIHALQVFGGIGFTQEHHLHFWLKRAKALEAEFGTAYYHRDLIVQRWEDVLGDRKRRLDASFAE